MASPDSTESPPGDHAPFAQSAGASAAADESSEIAGRLPFSVVIPTRDRPGPLARCLDALAELEYPREAFEVVVVDDGSASPPAAEIERRAGSLRVRLVARPHAGPAAARNAGAHAAGHAFLAFTDDDCMPAPGWLSAFERALGESPRAMVGGCTLNALAHNPFSAASQELIAYLYDYYNRERARFFCSNNVAMSRASFLDLGGFDAAFPFAAGEDRDLCDRWVLAGHPTVYADDALVHHAHDLGLRTFWRQHLRYGRAAAPYRELSAARRRDDVRIEPFTFYVDLVRYPFTRGDGPRVWRRAALLALSQVANSSGFVYESVRRRMRGTATGAARRP
jgi:GT2 family glycosyltransferase